MSSDPQYYAARAMEERELAIAAPNANARRAHLEMAARYAALADAEVMGDLPESESRAA